MVSVFALGKAIRDSLRTRRATLDELEVGPAVRESQSPVIFWTNIASMAIGAFVILAAVLISLFRVFISN
jgi:hypothetical protein